MNTQQLVRSIARHLNVVDSSNLESDALFDVVNAINSGLHLFFTEAPAVLKRKTISTVFKAPKTIPLTFVAQYSNLVTGTPFDSSWYGCGVRAQGAPQENEITGTSSLLDEWILPTLTTQAEILFDAFVIPVTIERIISNVLAYSNETPRGQVLYRDQAENYKSWRQWMPWHNPTRCEHYRIDPTAIIQGGTTAAILRIHPAPLIDTVVRFEAEISAASVTAAGVLAGHDLPIADAWVPLLIPLCEDALSYSPIWKDPKTRSDVRANAAATIANRIKKLANDFGCPNNSVGTPWKY